jgi:hypothetical protein
LLFFIVKRNKKYSKKKGVAWKQGKKGKGATNTIKRGGIVIEGLIRLEKTDITPGDGYLPETEEGLGQKKMNA